MVKGTFVTTPPVGYLMGGSYIGGGKFRTLVQILHSSAGESLPSARWLSGIILQMQGFHSGPSRAKDG
jgi:hypothetical protein